MQTSFTVAYGEMAMRRFVILQLGHLVQKMNVYDRTLRYLWKEHKIIEQVIYNYRKLTEGPYHQTVAQWQNEIKTHEKQKDPGFDPQPIQA
jgi:hypothetical protein